MKGLGGSMKKLYFVLLFLFQSQPGLLGNGTVVAIVPYFYKDGLAYFVMNKLVAGGAKLYEPFNYLKNRSDNDENNWAYACHQFFSTFSFRSLDLWRMSDTTYLLKIRDLYHLYFHEVHDRDQIEHLLTLKGIPVPLRDGSLDHDDCYSVKVIRAKKCRPKANVIFDQLRNALSPFMQEKYPIFLNELFLCDNEIIFDALDEISRNILERQKATPSLPRRFTNRLRGSFTSRSVPNFSSISSETESIRIVMEKVDLEGGGQDITFHRMPSEIRRWSTLGDILGTS